MYTQKEMDAAVVKALEEERLRIRTAIEGLPPIAQFGSASGGMMRTAILNLIVPAEV